MLLAFCFSAILLGMAVNEIFLVFNHTEPSLFTGSVYLAWSLVCLVVSLWLQVGRKP